MQTSSLLSRCVTHCQCQCTSLYL